MNDIDFAHKMEPFGGAKYYLGDKTKGWDCANSLKTFFESNGIKLPEELKGWNWHNYSTKWEADTKEGCQIMKEYFLALGDPVNVNYIRPGDIIVFEKDWICSVGIYIGNGNFQAASNPHGIVRMPLRFFKSAIIGVRRLIK